MNIQQEKTSEKTFEEKLKEVENEEDDSEEFTSEMDDETIESMKGTHEEDEEDDSVTEFNSVNNSAQIDDEVERILEATKAKRSSDTGDNPFTVDKCKNFSTAKIKKIKEKKVKLDREAHEIMYLSGPSFEEKEKARKKIESLNKRIIFDVYRFDLLPEDVKEMLVRWYIRNIPLAAMVKQINPKLTSLGLGQLCVIDLYILMFYIAKDKIKCNKIRDANEVVAKAHRTQVYYEYSLDQFAAFYKCWRYGFTNEECEIIAQTKGSKGSHAHARRIFSGLQLKARKLRDIKGRTIKRTVDIILARIIDSLRTACVGKSYPNAYVIFFNEFSQDTRIELAKMFPNLADKMLLPEAIKVQSGQADESIVDYMLERSGINMNGPKAKFIKSDITDSTNTKNNNAKNNNVEPHQMLLEGISSIPSGSTTKEVLSKLTYEQLAEVFDTAKSMLEEYNDHRDNMKASEFDNSLSHESWQEIAKKYKFESWENVNEDEKEDKDEKEDQNKEEEDHYLTRDQLERETALMANRVARTLLEDEVVKSTNFNESTPESTSALTDKEAKIEAEMKKAKEEIIESETSIPLSVRLKQVRDKKTNS